MRAMPWRPRTTVISIPPCAHDAEVAALVGAQEEVVDGVLERVAASAAGARRRLARPVEPPSWVAKPSSTRLASR
jgi:hypothetical protein